MVIVVLSVAFLAASCTRNGKRPGKGLFGEHCDEDKDCKSLICSGLDGETKLCTEKCTDPLGDECDTGFRCRRPEREEDLVCVCVDPRGCEREHPAPDEPCTESSECDDDIACTDDRCDGVGCVHAVNPDACEVGSSCDATEGCIENDPCDDSSQCETGSDPCRAFGRCDSASGRCQYDQVDADGDGRFPTECGGDDCDDANAGVAVGFADICDSTDNDCDGFFDEDGERMCGGMGCSLGSCACPPGTVDCTASGGGCSADLNSDPLNCGGCGFACELGFVCQNSTCIDIDECANGTMCPPHSTCANVFGSVECRCNAGFEPNAASSECIDVDECSRGLHSCSNANKCINTFGSFQCLCPDGFEDRGFGCVDVNECANGFDCGLHGFCQNLTGSFQCSCNQGYAPDPTTRVCVLVNECRAGVLPDFSWCDGACRDLRNDSNYCGSCYTSCYDDTHCSNRRCKCDDSELTYCDSTCVNTDTDEQHCGSCYHDCPSGSTCSGGECLCPMGQTPCGDQCVTLGTAQNCLSCGDSCPLGSTCTNAGCECPSSSPLACNGLCVNPEADELHCGNCYNYCPENATCVGGECQCPADAPDFCPDWGACFDYETSEEACGACGHYCDGICNEGSCSTGEQFALGGGMGCLRFADGRVGCFGSNENGRLGRGISTSLTAQPLGLLALTSITSIAARSAHACAVDSDGTLWCWGKNGSQQLGTDNTADQSSPVIARDGVAAVAVGASHTCVVLEGSGKVECIGSDAFGQRGDGQATAGLGVWTGPSGLEHVDQLVSGDNHLCALIDGDVYCWGDNTSGQLGNGASGAGNLVNAPGMKVAGLGKVEQIAAGQSHTCAISGGQVYCWGENSSYQSGMSDTADRTAPTALGITNAKAIGAGDAHSCALLTDYRAVCWGSGSHRQNGRNSTGPELRVIDGGWSQIALGSAHTCVVTDFGDFGCWGEGSSIANPSDTAVPVRIAR